MDKVKVLFDECLPLRPPNQNREILDNAVNGELFGMRSVVTEKRFTFKSPEINNVAFTYLWANFATSKILSSLRLRQRASSARSFILGMLYLLAAMSSSFAWTFAFSIRSV